MHTGMPVVPTPDMAAMPAPSPPHQPSPVVLHMPLLPGVRTWLGDFLELPPYQGPFDAVFMNAVFGNLADPRTALLKAALSLKPGGYAVISHPMGRAWHQQLAKDAPDMVPHLLPDAAGLQGLIQDLPLQVVQYTDDPELYLAVLQVRRQHIFCQARQVLCYTAGAGATSVAFHKPLLSSRGAPTGDYRGVTGPCGNYSLHTSWCEPRNTMVGR